MEKHIKDSWCRDSI